jgi:hypothetical protein
MILLVEVVAVDHQDLLFGAHLLLIQALAVMVVVAQILALALVVVAEIHMAEAAVEAVLELLLVVLVVLVLKVAFFSRFGMNSYDFSY